MSALRVARNCFPRQAKSGVLRCLALCLRHFKKRCVKTFLAASACCDGPVNGLVCQNDPCLNFCTLCLNFWTHFAQLRSLPLTYRSTSLTSAHLRSSSLNLPQKNSFAVNFAHFRSSLGNRLPTSLNFAHPRPLNFLHLCSFFISASF